MLTIIIITLILCSAFCFGWKEIAYSYSGIHVADILKKAPFFIWIFMALTAGTVLMTQHGGLSFLTNTDETVIVLVSIFLTLVILSTVGRPYSLVTIFWGTILSLMYSQEQTGADVVWLILLVSSVVAPILSSFITMLIHQLLRSWQKKMSTHLLVKQLYLKWIAAIGILAGCLAFAYNYALFIGILASSLALFKGGEVNWNLCIFAIFSATACIAPIVIHILRKQHNNNIPQQIASLYAQTLVLPLLNIALPHFLVTFPPVILSTNILKEGNAIAVEQGRNSRRIISMLTMALFSPLLAFLVGTGMKHLYERQHLFWAVFLFILLTCTLLKISYRQYKKGRNASRMLHDEVKHRNEMSNELNRLDVIAVTSQFDSMSREIDFKHKELINLSLYVQQQREYMTSVGEQIKALTRETDIKNIKKTLNEIDRDLKDTLRYPPEMEQIYQEVEKMHHDFVSRLLMRCPNLSERERRLAILLRLGFSSKEIASIVNLEPKSVEISRYRLRKKLQLERSENLVNYLQLL